MRQNYNSEGLLMTFEKVAQGEHCIPHHDVNEVALQRATSIVQTLARFNRQLLIYIEDSISTEKAPND